MRLTATKPTAFSRRHFLAGLGSLAATPVFAKSTLAENLIGRGAEEDIPLFASAFRKANGTYGIGILDDLGQVLAEVSLPGRGHGIAISPDKTRWVAFARRPGAFAVVIHPFDRVEPHVLAASKGRHFYGHGCFSADGRLLYSVENDFDAARGVVGVYDMSAAEPKRIGEFDTFGVGPHDILMSVDGRALIVANGGIETHPDKAREKLNLDSMAPSIVFLDVETGELLSIQALPRSLHQVSLRHMAMDAAGRVWVGGQFEGPENETPPLVVVVERDQPPRPTTIPTPIAVGLENYIGSVTANNDGSVIATSAPRGGQTLFWDTSTSAFLGAKPIPDGCGVAPIDQAGFLISDGNGALSYVGELDAPAEVIARPPGYAWDNHMSSIS